MNNEENSSSSTCDETDEEIFRYFSKGERLSGSWADIVEEEEELLKSLKDVSLEEESSIKLFVGQLPKDMKEDGIRNLFRDFVTVTDVCIIRNKLTKESRGCAFILVKGKEDADRAISLLHNKKILFPVFCFFFEEKN